MLKFVPSAALLLLAVMQTSAYAANCEGQNGKVIFEDDFTDDSGGWAIDHTANWDFSFGKSGLTLHMQNPATGVVFSNNTFAVTEGDFCVEAVLPKAVEADNGVGLVFFLGNDIKNFFMLSINSGDRIILWRYEAGNWVILGDLSDPKIKPEPGSVVALRVVVKANLITASVNGVELKKLRVQTPEVKLKFGVYISTDKPVPAPGMTFQFKKYKVAAGE
jgi:hypothetical protein